MNLDRFGPWARAVVSLITILAFIGMIGALIWMALRDKDFPPGIKETLLILVGVLAGEYKNVNGYWIGTSHGSSVKTTMMAGKDAGGSGG
jgi:hypothetical protein